MVLHEYAETGRPLLVLLAPMMVFGKDLYRLMAPCCKGDYCIVAPDWNEHRAVGGHISAELTIRSRCSHRGYMAAHPKEYIAENGRIIGNVGSIN